MNTHAVSSSYTDSRADIVVTSLGSDEGVEAVYAQLFGGQEVCLHALPPKSDINRDKQELC